MKRKLLIILITVSTIISAFIIYELVTAKKTYYINEKNLQIPIYTYHDIVETKDQIKDGCMQTTNETFINQILGLIKLGYTPINYQDLNEYKNEKKAIPKRSFIITFDDGYESFYTYVYPFAKEYNIPITVFVINSCVGGEGYFTWEQAKEMHDSGLISIYSHGLNHSEYDKIEPLQFSLEINEAYEILEEKLNDKNILKVFAYPYGNYTEDNINELAKYGYIQNLMDSKINLSKNLNLNKLHRSYPLNDSVFKILLKQLYRSMKYKGI